MKERQIISTGYGGAPRGTENCCEIGICVRSEFGAGKGENYELCRAVHAEQNAIIHASRLDMIGATLYLVGLDYERGQIMPDAEPCQICKRMIVNAGIDKVIALKGRDAIRKMSVRGWRTRNLGEIRRADGGRWRPVKPKGYGYGSVKHLKLK